MTKKAHEDSAQRTHPLGFEPGGCRWKELRPWEDSAKSSSMPVETATRAVIPVFANSPVAGLMQKWVSPTPRTLLGTVPTLSALGELRKVSGAGHSEQLYFPENSEYARLAIGRMLG